MKGISTSQIRILLAQNGVFLAMVALALVFGAIRPRFLSPENLMTIVQQVAELGILALAVAFVAMVGSVDLSVGSIASMGAVISGIVMSRSGNIFGAVALGLAFGLGAGLLNGVLIAYLNLNPFVVTLGFLSVWGGMAMYITNGKTITGMPQAFKDFSLLAPLGLRIQIWMLLVGVAAAWYLLNRTAKGKEVLAVGGNPRAAFLMGINVRATRLQVMAASGVFAALIGILLSAKNFAASPAVGSGFELTSLTVVLLGGVAFEGGSGRISGVVAGLLFVGVLQNGLIILGVSAYLKTVFTGLVLVVAVLMDSTIQKIVRSAWNQVARGAPTTEEGDAVAETQEGAGV
jgi:ribose/xylose/arabinose/galactoside ABC-type transport system permease subunit